MENKRAFGTAIIGGAIAASVVIAARLDSRTISAIFGAVCATVVAVPATALVTASVVRRRQTAQDYERRRHGYPYPAQQQPPVVVVSPPQQPALPYPQSWPPGDLDRLPVARRFSVIGEDFGEDD